MALVHLIHASLLRQTEMSVIVKGKRRGVQTKQNKTQHSIHGTPTVCPVPSLCSLHCLFFFFLSIEGHTCGIWKFQGQGSNWSCSCWPTPQPHQIPATSATYTAACNNTRSLTAERGRHRTHTLTNTTLGP